ncbi:MAG: hypothetical protein OEZ43_19130 [Gammaproteobacteria bacterium]|nr:hypothetical protein [Gammaproteobacteria bacterium]
MRKEYDFSKAKRGTFFHKDATVILPIYLEADITDYLSEKAKAKGVELSDIVNELLRKDIDLIEGMK